MFFGSCVMIFVAYVMEAGAGAEVTAKCVQRLPPHEHELHFYCRFDNPKTCRFILLLGFRRQFMVTFGGSAKGERISDKSTAAISNDQMTYVHGEQVRSPCAEKPLKKYTIFRCAKRKEESRSIGVWWKRRHWKLYMITLFVMSIDGDAYVNPNTRRIRRQWQ